jgi:hypothetical protein
MPGGEELLRPRPRLFRLNHWLLSPWTERKAIECHPDFEREYALKACEAWANKKDRHPY